MTIFKYVGRWHIHLVGGTGAINDIGGVYEVPSKKWATWIANLFKRISYDIY